MRSTIPALFALCAAAVSAQESSFGPGATVPAALRDAFGNASFGYPFSQAPNRFQQVFSGSELRGSLDIRGIALRKDDRINSYQGRTIDVEIRIGHTTKDYVTLSNNFAANFDAGAPVVVLPRQQLKLANMPFVPPLDPYEFLQEISFDREFAFRGQGRNLLLEVVVYGNDVNNQSFLYPLDSGNGTTTTMLYANGPTAATGALSTGHGLALRMLCPADRRACFAHMFNPSGPAGRRANTLTGGNPPLLGTTCTFDLYAPSYDFGSVLLSVGVNHRQILPMPGYSLQLYTDLGTLVLALPVPLSSGFASLQIPVPATPSLAGIDLPWQGVAAGFARPDLLGATNLVVMNLGTSLLGSAVLAIMHGPFDIKPNDFLKNESNERVVIHENRSETPDKINIQGSKPRTQGPLRIVIEAPGRGPVYVDVPSGQDTFSVTVTVPPGGKVYLGNGDPVSMSGVTYEVTVVD